MPTLFTQSDPGDLFCVRNAGNIIPHADATRQIVNHKYMHLHGEERLVAAIEENVLIQINNLSTHPGIVMLLATGELKVFGWYFDIATGRVHHYNPTSGQFEALPHEEQGVSAIPLRHI